MNPEHDGAPHWDHDQASSGWGWYESNQPAMATEEREKYESERAAVNKNYTI